MPTGRIQVHLIDGTYELFRQFYGRPDPGPFGAAASVLRSTLSLLGGGATHVAVATDHVIESFRNELWPGYKTSAGLDRAILDQIPVLEDALAAMGVTVWPMVEHEADDALASASKIAAADPRVERVLVCTPDKDLGQCVGGKVIQWDRRQDLFLDAAAIAKKFGVGPAFIPDWLALVGDNADGFPGLPGWGEKSAAAVLGRYGHLEDIPRTEGKWDVRVRGAEKLAGTLREHWDRALLFRRIATCIDDLKVGTVGDWAWRGPTSRFDEVITRLGATRVRQDLERIVRR